MKLKDGLKIICLILFILISISAVSAANNQTESITENFNVDDNILSLDEFNNEFLGNVNDGSFADLDNAINGGTSTNIELDTNYTFSSSDSGKNGIVINKNHLVIDGKGHKIDGGSRARIFYVNSTNVTLKNINFVNGYHRSLGGAIYNYGEALQVINCTFENNIAKSNDENVAWAGAIYSYPDSFTGIVNSKFINNSADSGGAIVLREEEGTRQYVINCTFIDNHANDDGGAIFGYGVWGSYENIVGCTFINNSASEGSAVYQAISSFVTVTNSIFLNNSGSMMDSFARNFVANNNWWGNDVNNKDARPNVTSQITVENWLYFDLNVNPESSSATVSINNLYNSTTGKTSVYTTSKLPSLDVDINAINASFTTNKIALGNSGIATVNYDLYGDCTITANYGNIAVSKKFKSGSFKELQALIDGADNNTVITLEKDYVYTLGVDKSSVGVTVNKYNVTIDGNGHFVNGAGKSRVFYVDYSNHITFKNIIITNGKTSLVDGAGIFSSCRYCNFINCTFINNTADGNDGGGALYIYSINTNVVDCTFINNVHDYSAGGAIFWMTLSDAASTCNIKNSIFKDNIANRDGGAIYFLYGGAEISNCAFINNTAGRSGGAIVDENYNNVTTTISDCTFIANQALSKDMLCGGGAIFSNKDLIYDCLFKENEAKNGAAIFAEYYSDIEKCMFINNTAGNGGIIFFEYYNNIINSIFLNNVVPYGINWIVTPFEGNVADYNWFANTGKNYDSRPGVSTLSQMNKWLFLNATDIVYNEDSNTYGLKYNFLVYDSDNDDFFSYDFNNLPLVNLKLSSENLTLADDVVSLGENVNAVSTYYKASITAEIENVKYTVPFKFQIKSWFEGNSTIEVHVTKTNYLDFYIRPYEDDTQPFLTDRLTFISSNSSIVTVDSKGKIKGVSVGLANVTIKYNGLTPIGLDKYKPSNFTVLVNVTRIPTEIKVIYDLPQQVNVGSTEQLICSLNPYGAGSLNYESNDTSVADVISNIVKGYKEGFVNITVSYPGNAKYAPSSMSFIVEVGKKHTSINVPEQEIGMDKGGIYYIGPSLSPYLSGVLFDYSSNDTSVATVEDGAITAVGGGVANITITYPGNDKLKKSSINMTVTVIEYATYFEVNSTMKVNVTDDAYIGATLKVLNGDTLIPPTAYRHYISNDTSIVSVDDSGRIVGNALGKANITVIFDGYSKYVPCRASVIVEVVDVSTKINVEPVINLCVDDYAKINASLNYGNSRELKYESNDTSIVSINKYGYLLAKKVGLAKILITYDGTVKYLPANATAIINVTYVPTKVDVGKTFSLIVGENESLNATLNPFEGAELTYLSNNESIVTVDENGVVSALKEGEAIITISYAGSSKYAPVSQDVAITTYNDFIPTKIELNTTITLYAGNKTDIGVELIPSNAGKLNFTSNDTDVVTVDENGIITAVGEGKALITIDLVRDNPRFQENAAQVVVNVLTVPTKIDAANSIAVNLTESALIDYNFSHPEAGNLEFIISNPNIAIIENGVVTGKAVGNTSVTIKFNGNRQYGQSNATFIVNVVDVPVVIDVVGFVGVNVTESVDLGAVLLPGDAGSLVYSSSNESVVVVDNAGRITGVGVGEADIVVSFEAIGKYHENSTKVHVKVVDVPVVIDVVGFVGVNVTESVDLGAVLLPGDAGSLVYSSSNESVVVVDNAGRITGVGVGEADILVSFEATGKYHENSTKVHVTVTMVKTEIEIENKDISLAIDDNVNINATLNPTGAGKLNFTSNDTDVVIVDENGQITALKEGSAKITVSYEGHGKFTSAEEIVNVTVSLIPTEIKINKNMTLEIGTGLILKPILNPSNIRDLTYESNDTSVVSIENGYLFTNGYGVALITICYAGNEKYAPSNATITATVLPRTLHIDVENEISIGYGDSKSMAATLKDQYNIPFDFTLKYESTNPAIASVDENGVITANSIGNVNITIKYVGNAVYYPTNTTVCVIVTPMVTEIVAGDKISLKVDEETTIGAKLSRPEDGKLNYISSDESVVTVDGNGKVTAVGEGSAIITVSYDGDENYLFSSANVSVVVSKIATSIKANNQHILIDDNINLNAALSPNNATLRYSSSNSDVASVDSNGKVTGIGAGSAMITIRYDGNYKYKSSERIVTVTVSKIPTTISLEPISMYVGDEYVIRDVLSPAEAGKLTYEVFDWTIADVDSKGVVTAYQDGSTELTVIFKGNEKYLPSNATVGVSVIKKTVSSSDYKLKSEFNDDTGEAIFSIELPEDMDGTFVVYVDGEAYSENIQNGRATIVVDGLMPGDHSITMEYTGNEIYSGFQKNDEVYVATIEMNKNADVSVLYTQAATYTVHLTKDTQVMEGKTVTFEVNDQIYYASTDKQGFASISLKLPPKTYEVTAKYGGVEVTNKITVKHVIVAKNIKAKKSAALLNIKVSLKKVNGKFLKGKKITLKFNGKKFKAKTNKKGVATFKIKSKYLSKLKVGKKYKYTVSYLKDKVTKKVAIKK